VTRRAPAMLNGFAPNPDVANPADGFLLSEIYNPIVVAAVTPRVPPPYARDRRVRVARLRNGLLQYRPGIKLNSSRWRLAVQQQKGCGEIVVYRCHTFCEFVLEG